jgi:hypothetical protein
MLGLVNLAGLLIINTMLLHMLSSLPNGMFWRLWMLLRVLLVKSPVCLIFIVHH